MIDNIHYRLAKIEDIESLVELRLLMQLEVNALESIQNENEYKLKVKTYLLESIKNNTYYAMIAEIQIEGKNKIISNAGVCFYQKPPSISGGTGLVGYVTNVYTDLNYRGKGIGTNIMKNIKELAIVLKADNLHLGATSDGLSIYKAVGFSEPRFVALTLKLPPDQHK
jgi:GNAT superfamily N-acetyltransferase